MPTRMTIPAYFPIEGKFTDSLGNTITPDWNWAMQQFDRVAAAGPAVRSVVVEQLYAWGMGDPQNPPPNTPNASDVRAKMQQCRAAGQIVYGYVACSGGAVPLERSQNPPSPDDTWWYVPRGRDKWWVPLTGNVTPVASQGYPGGGYYPCLRDQIDAWYNLYAEYLDGIYVDEAPTDCLNEQTANYGAHISQNYADYCQYIRSHTRPGSSDPAFVYLLDAGYGDVDPNGPGWFENLPFTDVAVWENGVAHYRNNWGAYDPCTPEVSGEPTPIDARPWWNVPGSEATRIHIVNGGVLAEATDSGQSWKQVLQSLMALAESRGSETVWITEAAKGPHGSVYAFLPPYWDDEVALCTPPSSS
jgi:hypothetical protein